MAAARQSQVAVTSRPARGAWIEIRRATTNACRDGSRPARGAWIEIRNAPASSASPYPSRPARGAWIEMASSCGRWACRTVAPRKGRGERKSHPFLRRHVRRRKYFSACNRARGRPTGFPAKSHRGGHRPPHFIGGIDIRFFYYFLITFSTSTVPSLYVVRTKFKPGASSLCTAPLIE